MIEVKREDREEKGIVGDNIKGEGDRVVNIVDQFGDGKILGEGLFLKKIQGFSLRQFFG